MEETYLGECSLEDVSVNPIRVLLSTEASVEDEVDEGEVERGNGYDSLFLSHEHLFVSRKPESDERLTHFRDSVKWW